MAAEREIESDSDDWEDVESGEGGVAPCPCLFCPRELLTAAEALEHCSGEHGVDLLQMRTRLGQYLVSQLYCVCRWPIFIIQ